MNVSTALEQRRSIKYFDPNHTIPTADLHTIIQQAQLAPSAFNLQHWHVVDIADPQKRQAIRNAAWDQPQMTDASAVLVVCMDLKAWQKDPAQYWQHTDAETQTLMSESIQTFYQNNPALERDEALRSASLFCMNIMLMAKELGYDSCPMDGFDYPTVAELINLPTDHDICMIITLGKLKALPWPRGSIKELNNTLSTDSFNSAK